MDDGGKQIFPISTQFRRHLKIPPSTQNKNSPLQFFAPSNLAQFSIHPMFKLALLGDVLLNVVAIIFFLGGKYQVQTFKEDIILILILIILKMFLRNNI